MNSRDSSLLAFMLVLILIFTSACADEQHSVLFKNLPVSLAGTNYAVDSNGVSYVIIGPSKVVFQLSLPERTFVKSWLLPAIPKRVFFSQEGFIVVTKEEILRLTPAGTVEIGRVPTVAAIDGLPVQKIKVSRQQLVPVLSSMDTLLWMVASSGSPTDEPLYFAWSDLQGKVLKWREFKDLRRARSAVRFSPSGRAAVFPYLSQKGGLFVTADTQIQVKKVRSILSKGYRAEVLLCENTQSEFVYETNKLSTVPNAENQYIKQLADENVDLFLLSSKFAVRSDASVCAFSDQGSVDYPNLEFCAISGRFVYMVDREKRMFAKAEISSGKCLLRTPKEFLSTSTVK
ncbi:MAG: hypothetical protein U5N86_00495 [Planctomycetota bacterium]|nr:hypothetical protein [Planctomycetota bacterium]